MKTIKQRREQLQQAQALQHRLRQLEKAGFPALFNKLAIRLRLAWLDLEDELPLTCDDADLWD